MTKARPASGDLLTVLEAAQKLGITRRNVYELIAKTAPWQRVSRVAATHSTQGCRRAHSIPQRWRSWPPIASC